MKDTNFSGNPFVDAGLAGMCAAAGVQRLSDLDEATITRAANKLIDLMTSDAAFAQRTLIIDKKEKKTAFITSEMSVIFTNNNALSNPSNKGIAKKQKYEARVRGKLTALLESLKNPKQDATQNCFVDGNPACFTVGNDEFPLVDSRSKRNFHPGLREGHPVGALTALAVEFFPLSVLRTGLNSGFFWFVHTADEEIAIAVANLTYGFMVDAINKGDFGFFGNWKINNRGKETALVALIRELTSDKDALSRIKIQQLDLPIAAYIFSNDSRSPSVEVHDLPHPLWKFFLQLQGSSRTIDRFNKEILGAEKKGWLLAREMLNGRPIVGKCLVRSKEREFVMLRGGWNAHAHYAHEVLKMEIILLRDIETLSQRLLEHPKAKDFRLDLERASGIGEVGSAFLRLVRNSIMNDATFARLNPPESPSLVLQSRDFLLAALYDRIYCAETNREFIIWDSDKTPEAPEPSPILVLVQDVGNAIMQDDRHNVLAADLAKATKTRDVRGVMLRSAKRGHLNWEQWVSLFPPEKPWVSLLFRDYLLAYVYCHIDRAETEHLPDPQIIPNQSLRTDEDETSQFLALVS